jgi:hypothetical protein
LYKPERTRKECILERLTPAQESIDESAAGAEMRTDGVDGSMDSSGIFLESESGKDQQ